MDKEGQYINCSCGHCIDVSNIQHPDQMPMEMALGFQYVGDEYYFHPEYQMTFRAVTVDCDNCGRKITMPSL